MSTSVKRKISIDYITIKAGSILLWKEYNFFKRLWSKLTKKSLPYNRMALFVEGCDYIGDPEKDCVLLELKKNYNKKEINKLAILVDDNYFEYFGTNVADLCTTLNLIRPNTFKNNCTTIQELLEENKYYTVKNLKNAEDWKELLY